MIIIILTTSRKSWRSSTWLLVIFD